MSAPEIIKEVETLTKPQRVALLAFILARGFKVSTHSDGTRVNLDALDSLSLFHIQQVITLLRYGEDRSPVSTLPEEGVDTCEGQELATEESIQV